MKGFNYATKIQALLAKAEDPAATPEEAALFQAKAEQLMAKYRIEEEDALARDEASSSPIRHEVVIRQGHTDMSSWYPVLFQTIARHTGIRCVHKYSVGKVMAICVGYEGDIRYAEFLFTAAHLMFATKIDPTWSDERTLEENVYLLRNAGIERRRIADYAWGYGAGDDPSSRSKIQRIYLKECSQRGEEARAAGLSHNTATYREAYARSFHETLRRRLMEARDAADSVMGGVVLYGRDERVAEAFYALFPEQRPTEHPATQHECSACKKTKHPSGQCRMHRPRAWTQREEARYQRLYNSPSARAGASSGREAAQGVVIQRGHSPAPRRIEG